MVMVDWAELRSAGLARADHALRAREDRKELIALVCEWLAASQDIPISDLSEIAVHPATIRLERDFEDWRLPEVAEFLRTFAQREGSIQEGTWLFALLLGWASARVFLEGLHVRECRPVKLWGLDAFGAWDAFANELSILIESDQSAEAALWNQLSVIIQEVDADPSKYSHTLDMDAVRTAVDTYRAAPDVQEAWETRLDAHVMFPFGFLFDLARKLDLERLLDAIGQLPHPVFVAQVLPDENDLDDDKLLALVAAAPAGWDNEGIYQSAGMIILLLLQEVGRRVRRLAWAGEQPPPPVPHSHRSSLDPRTFEVQRFIDSLLEVIKGRSDGTSLSWSWLERLVFEGERRGAWRLERQQGSGFILDPLIMLIGSIAARLQPRDDALAWIKLRDPLWQVDRIAAVMTVRASDKNIDGAGLARSLEDLLLTIEPLYAGAHEAVARRDSIVGRIGGGYILKLDAPDKFLLEIWQRLRPTRERAWRSASKGEIGNNSAELLILWSLFALETAPTKLRASMQPALKSMLKDALQTDYQEFRAGFWDLALRRFARSLSGIDGTKQRNVDRLVEFLRPYVTASQLFFDLILAFQQRGMRPEVLDQALQTLGTNLSDLVHQFLATEKLRITRRTYDEAWLRQVRALAGVVEA